VYLLHNSHAHSLLTESTSVKLSVMLSMQRHSF